MTIRALRVEIARPCEGTWDELGSLLRTQRRLMAQLLRAGMDARIACGVLPTWMVKEHVAPEAAGASSSTVVYQAIKIALEQAQKGTWRNPAALELPGGMISALSQRVTQSYVKRPGFNSAQPIPVRKQETRIESVKDESAGKGERIVIEMKLLAKGRTRVYVRPSKGSHWSLLRKIARKEIAHGDCRIVLDEERKKWYVLLAYEAPERVVATQLDPQRALIIHRGLRNALTLMSTTGHVRYESGAKMFGQLRKLEARMRDTRAISQATLGKGASGHGKDRRYEHYTKPLQHKRENDVKTWCQQMGAFVVKTAIELGCGRVVIEEYGGLKPNKDPAVRRLLIRFPLSELKTAIKNAIALVPGLTLDECPAEYVSTTCPACGNQDTRQHNTHTGTFHCAMCALERPVDFVAVLHMLRRSGADSTLWDERMDKIEKLRSMLADAAE